LPYTKGRGRVGREGVVKKAMYLILLCALPLGGCLNRTPFFDLVSTPSSEIPRVITYDPASNLENVPVDAWMCMLFSKPMDRASVENNFVFLYGEHRFGASDGTFHWDSSSRVAAFDPSSDLPANQEMIVQLGKGMISIDGLHLDQNYIWSFTTSGSASPATPFNVTSVAGSSTLPGGLQTAESQISIDFDREMLRCTVEGSFLLMSDTFDDIRTVDHGRFEWSEPAAGTTRATYIPNEPLGANRTYNVYLYSNGIIVVDIAGNQIDPLSLFFAPPNYFTFMTIDDAIYVSPAGNNGNPGYHSSLPVQDLATGISRALASGVKHIKVAEGTYTEDVVLNGAQYNGFRIQGSWTSDFLFYDPDPLAFPATIQAATNSYAVTLSGVSGLVLQGISARGLSSAPPDINGGVLVNGGSTDITIDSCSLEGSDNAQEGHGLYITGSSSDIVIRNSRTNGVPAGGAAVGCGISIDNASNIRIKNNPNLSGGQGSSSNTSIDIIGPASGITIEGNTIPAGSAGKRHGILIGGSTDNIQIQRNTLISGGPAGSGPAFGIYVSGIGASATIEDNELIEGGTVLNSESYGILVENGAVVNIYRNTIIGGTDTSTAVNNLQNGVIFINAGDCNLFSNFIAGSYPGTDRDNDCYGVSILSSDVDIIGNTIHGQGEAGGAGITAAIRGDGTRSNIVNNILMGGEGSGAQHGIILGDFILSNNDVLIRNNSFASDMCATSLLRDDGTPSDLVTITDLQSLYNISPRKPTGNNRFVAAPPLDDFVTYGEIEFYDPFNAYYVVDTVTSTNPFLVVNNGYDLGSLLGSADLQEARFDWFYIERSMNSIDRGAHEFSP
jgi:nitrous oxidase accessory protein NosD